jgi:hypothetical protein
MSLDYSIGYLSVADAKQAGIHTAFVENGEGHFSEASPENVQNSMDYHARLSNDISFQLHNLLTITNKGTDTEMGKIHASLVLFSSIMSVCTICHTDCPWHLNSFRTRSIFLRHLQKMCKIPWTTMLDCQMIYHFNYIILGVHHHIPLQDLHISLHTKQQ